MDTFTKLPTTTKVVLGGTVAFLIVSFFNWQEVDFGVGSAGVTMWHGWGTIAGIVALALLAWEGLRSPTSTFRYRSATRCSVRSSRSSSRC